MQHKTSLLKQSIQFIENLIWEEVKIKGFQTEDKYTDRDGEI